MIAKIMNDIIIVCAPQMITAALTCVSNTALNLHQNVLVVVVIILHLIAEPA